MKPTDRVFLMGAVACAGSFFLAGCGGGGAESGPVLQKPLRAESVKVVRVNNENEFSIIDGARAIDAVDEALNERIDSDPASAGLFKAVKDVGGFSAFAQLLEVGENGKIRAALQAHGVAHDLDSSRDSLTGLEKSRAVEVTVKAMAIGDCVQFFPPSDRNKLFTVGAHAVFIDNVGRPSYAVLKGGPTIPVVPGARTACQTTVGKWGTVGDVGGHLIAASLGGWGGRANIVPQDGVVNNTGWRVVEGVPANCRRHANITYTVAVSYPTILDVRPDKFFANIVVDHPTFGRQEGVLINYPNRDLPPATMQAAQAFKNFSLPYCPGL